MPTSLPLPINVGPLTGLGSLSLHLGGRLARFNDEYAKGRIPDVIWDLTNVEPRRMSLAGLTAFLAVAHRMRQVTGHPHQAKCRWDPQVLSFWWDIDFFRLSQDYDLLEWPKEMFGGFTPGIINPDTKILAFDYQDVPDQTDLANWKQWKDDNREIVKRELFLRAGRIFTATKRAPGFPDSTRDRVLITAAELVVNVLMHGRTTAFVGLQRSKAGVTIAVCDCGCGFAKTVSEQLRPHVGQLSHIQALLAGSVINWREFGLRGAIDTVVRRGGWVVMASYDSDLRIELPLWERILEQLRDSNDPKELLNVFSLLGAAATTAHNKYSNREGFYRVWDTGVRGARVAFELPLLGPSSQYSGYTWR